MWMRPQVMLGFLTITLVAMLFMLLVGCSEAQINQWRWTPAPKEAQANRVQYAHDVPFTAGAEGLTAEERRRLDDFLAKVRIGYGDRVLLVAGPSGGKAGEGDLRSRRAEAIAAYLRSRRIKGRIIAGGFGITAPAKDRVKVIVRRLVVTLPPCPDWTSLPGWNVNNTVSSNWSCASAINLGRMVADPGDLVRGRPMDPGDGEFFATAIENYRKGETKALSPEDVGQIESQQKTQSGGSSSSASGGGLN